jgi:hypothetical protein
MNSIDQKENLILNQLDAEKHFKTLYFDKLILLAVEKCLRANKDFCRSHNYDTEHAQAEIIDMRNKHVEACFDKIFAFHKIYDEELNKFDKIN